MEEQLSSGACRHVPALFILDQASVTGDSGVRAVCDLTCSGVQRTVVTSSRKVSQVSLEWLSAKEPIVHAVVLSILLAGSLEALQPLSLAFRNSVAKADPGLAGKSKIVTNRIK